MKKILSMIISIVVFMSFANGASINAATEPGDDSDVITLEDGTEVYYGNEINGGVDLSSSNENVQKAEKLEVSPRIPVKTLNIPFQTQANDYYCGPASASMIVRGLGFNKSQSQMATLLGTTVNGTGAGDSVANALNSVVGSKATFRWVWHNYQNISTLRSHTISAIDYGNGVMLNTMESPGDNYLLGHDVGYTLYHFGVIRGYNTSAETGLYMDPGYGKFGGFVKEQNATWVNLSYAAGGRGYAW